MPKTDESIKNEIIKDYQDFRGRGGFRTMKQSDKYKDGPPAGTLASIAADYPIPNKWRSWFGLPDLAPAPICPDCGIHHLKGCPYAPKFPRSRRYAKLEIHKEYPNKAARSILDNMEVGAIRDLITALEIGLDELTPYEWIPLTEHESSIVSRETLVHERRGNQ